MLEWADEELAALIRRVLPPRRPEWRVQVVDNPDEACAMFTQDILRVQRHWREAVYEAGLHLVVGHYPLSLERTRPLPRAGARVAAEVWKARAIRRDGKVNLTGVVGYVARLVGGKDLAFVKSRKEATRLARQGISGCSPARGHSTRARARRDAENLGPADRSRIRGDLGQAMGPADHGRPSEYPRGRAFGPPSSDRAAASSGARPELAFAHSASALRLSQSI